jgi:CxxC motif-containing protein (DUF1111 family)
MAQFGGFSAPATKAPAVELPAEQPAVPPLAQIQRGAEMFSRQWKAGDSHTPTGDGLGPMFNARSCAECHNLGGIGGGGKKDNNVDLLSLILPTNKEKLGIPKFRESMTEFHPAFTAGTTSVLRFITLHKFSNEPFYGGWLKMMKLVSQHPAEDGGPLSKQPSSKPNRSAYTHADKTRRVGAVDDSSAIAAAALVKFQLTQRNTPALFGLGVIDTIPVEVIQQAAREQAKRHTGVKGQVALSGTGKVGKFGWRGQTATLKEFVMGACANELGLEVPGQAQPIDPLDPTHKSPGLDLTQEQCNDLTAFVASFPPPTRREPANSRDSERVAAGEHLFDTTGCSACHMERLGNVNGIYSDLLLHDMGATLADPVPANSNASTGLSPGGSLGGGYYGGSRANDVFVAVPVETLRQWRTPPLWGVADSAPYLHDGRAATLQEAILAHGGEANGSRTRFSALATADRGKLLAFLNSLVAAQK